MRKISVRWFIVAFIRHSLPVILMLFIAMTLLQNPELFMRLGNVLQHWRYGFLVMHSALYVLLLLAWPAIVRSIVARQKGAVSVSQIHTAESAGKYLVAMLAFFELLILLRHA